MKRTLIFLFLSFLHYWNSGLTHAQFTSELNDQEYKTATITRGPYLQSGTPTSIIMRWRTNLPTISKVVYGLQLNELDHTIQINKKTTEHTVHLSDLPPSTKYYYQVYVTEDKFIKTDSSYYFITSPDKRADRPIRIWAFGDFGLGNDIARQVKESYLDYSQGRHTDAWLMLGDIAYYSGMDKEFQRALFDNMYDEILRNTVAWPTPGNHDCRSATSKIESGPYYEIFTLPKEGEAGGYPSHTEAYYSFNYGNIHIISLDSEECPRNKDGNMANWLKRDLEMNDSEWLIAYFHHPPYTKGTHDSDHKRDSRGRMIEIRENILPILEAHSVDLVLSGHSHVYERSHLIYGHYGFSDSFDRAEMVIGKPKRKQGMLKYTKEKDGFGTMYIVCGTGSHKPHDTLLDHPAMNFCTDQYEGSLSIEIKDNLLLGRFINDNGRVKDSFSIEKVVNPADSEKGLFE